MWMIEVCNAFLILRDIHKFPKSLNRFDLNRDYVEMSILAKFCIFKIASFVTKPLQYNSIFDFGNVHILNEIGTYILTS